LGYDDLNEVKQAVGENFRTNV